VASHTEKLIPPMKKEVPPDVASRCTLHLNYLNYNYSRKEILELKKEGWTCYYNCAGHSRVKCKGSAKLNVHTNKIKVTHEHTEDCMVLAKRKREGEFEFIDATDEMSALTETYAVSLTGVPAKEIATRVMKETLDKYKGNAVSYLKINEMMPIVHSKRRGEFGDWETQIKIAPLRYASDTDLRPFLLFNNQVLVNGEYEHMVGWGHPNLVNLTSRSGLNIFADCTFSVVPKEFKQLLILMIYDEATQLYLPIFYVLLQSKHEDAYYEALHQCIRSTKYKMNANSFTSDYELPLIKSLKMQFTKANPALCSFHHKQCLKKRLEKKTKIPPPLVTKLIGPFGLISVLYVIPIKEIIKKGIPYVRYHMDEGSYKTEFDEFWTYFKHTWVSDIYDPKYWNLRHIIDSDCPEELLVNRTNNPLERYNRTLAECFNHCTHPTMVEFVKVIRNEGVRVAELHDMTFRNLIQRPSRNLPIIPEIPQDYEHFKP